MAEEQPKTTWLDGTLGFFATAVPFVAALVRTAPNGTWRDDLPAVRDLGLVAVGIGGSVSTLAAQTLSLFPVGSRSFRATVGSLIALAIATNILFRLVRRTLGATSDSPRLAAVLSAIATLTAAMSPTWQREATSSGGAMIATALTLWAMDKALRCLDPESGVSARSWIALGVLLGLDFAESPAAAGAAVFAATTLALARRYGLVDASRLRLPPPRVFGQALAAGVFVALLCLSPLALRPLAPRAFADVGLALSASSVAAMDVPTSTTTALAAWTDEIGVVSLLVSAFGVFLALGRPSSRALVVPLLAVVLLDTLFPARSAGVLTADPLAALRQLAVAAITLSSALGVHAVVRTLLLARIPMAKSAAGLVVVFHLTLVALTSEEAGFAADRSEQTTAEAWTDEALERLPPNAAVLVRSPALAWRLWAAMLTRGQRPDVVVIPVQLLSRGSVAASLIGRSRELEALVRDFALSGRPTEFALSRLADVRPLRVELDHAWPKRLVGHLNIRGLWLEYAPQPLGPSDRRIGAVAARAPIRRMLDAIAKAPVPDSSTAAVVSETLRDHSIVLASLGDLSEANQFIDRATELAAQVPRSLLRPRPFALKGIRRMTARRTKPAEPAPKAATPRPRR